MALNVRKKNWALAGALGVCFLLSAACDPPGKPKKEESQAETLDFKTLYSQNCAGCHGVDGRYGPGRILNDGLYQAVLPRAELKKVLVHGRPGTSMPPWALSEGGPLSDKQIDALVDGIKKNWSKPINLHGVPLPAYSAGDKTGDANAGRKIFAVSCFMCHGPGAKVGLVTDPHYLSLVSNQMLRTAVIVGRSDLGMPDYRYLKMGKPLSDDDITNVVAFLISKRPSTPEIDAMAKSIELHPGSAQHLSPGAIDTGTGASGNLGRGDEGSGNGPGSPRQERKEGNKSAGSGSQQGIK